MNPNQNTLTFITQVSDPLAQTQEPQNGCPVPGGPSGEILVSELHGKYYNANYRNHLYMATASGVTLPVVAAGVASVFSLMNPLNSGKNLILLRAAIGTVLATTVVDIAGIYYLQNPVNASLTAGTIKSGILGSGAPSVATFYTANTHTAQTPILAANIGGYGAATDGSGNFFWRDFDGSIIVPPATCIDILMSTAASTGSGMAVELTWMEAPQ
jgi:hypothetical protein